MDRKKLVLLLGALVVAIGTALMARSMFAGASAPQAQAAAAVPAQPQGPKVLVAKRALPLGTIITADAVGYQLWPKELVQDAYFVDGEADMSKLLGTVVRYPITAGSPVTQGALVAPGDRGFLAAALGPGMRAVTVSVSEKTAVGGFVFPGDHVDLMLTQSASNGDGEGSGTQSATETILHNLRVLATDQATESTTNDEGKTVVRPSRTVTLEATPKIAEKIAVAQTLGTLSLSLRSLSDSQSDLDRAVAEGNFKVPNGLSKDAETRLIANASSARQDGGTTFTTGTEVSRFKRNSVVAAKAEAAAKAAGASGAPVQMGPAVRVFRGEGVSVQPIGGSVRNLNNQQAKGAAQVGRTMSGATAAQMIAG